MDENRNIIHYVLSSMNIYSQGFNTHYSYQIKKKMLDDNAGIHYLIFKSSFVNV